MRDPLSAALSDFHRTKSGGADRHISHANRKFFDDGKKWHEFAMKYVSKWKWFFDVMFKRYDAKGKKYVEYIVLKIQLWNFMPNFVDFFLIDRKRFFLGLKIFS